MNENRTELFAGVFLFVGLALIAALVVKFGEIGDVFRKKYSLSVEFPSAGGVVAGSEVRLNDVPVGKIASSPKLNKNGDGVLFDLEIFGDVKIPRNSSFVLSREGLVGDSFLSITPPLKLEARSSHTIPFARNQLGELKVGALVRDSSARNIGKVSRIVIPEDPEAEMVSISISIEDAISGNAEFRVAMESGEVVLQFEPSFYRDGDRVKGAKGALDEIRQKGEETLADLATVLKRLDSTLGTFQTDFLSEESKTNFRTSLNELTASIQKMNREVLNDENTKNLSQFVSNLTSLSKNLKESGERLDPIMSSIEKATGDLPDTVEKLRIAMDNVSTLSQSIASSEGLVDSMINDKEMRKTVENALENLEVFSRKLKDGGILRYQRGSEEEEGEERKGLFGRLRN